MQYINKGVRKKLCTLFYYDGPTGQTKYGEKIWYDHS
jgi:hypothetical protein